MDQVIREALEAKQRLLEQRLSAFQDRVRQTASNMELELEEVRKTQRDLTVVSEALHDAEWASADRIRTRLQKAMQQNINEEPELQSFSIPNGPEIIGKRCNGSIVTIEGRGNTLFKIVGYDEQHDAFNVERVKLLVNFDG